MTAAGVAQHHSRWRDAWIGAAIVLVTVVAYVPAFRAGWIWDDDYYVTQNPNLREEGGLWRAWTRVGLPNGGTPQYYPLVHTTFRLEHALYGDAPAGYHVDNVLLHAASAVLLWRVLVTLGVAGAPVAAALWAVHPVNVESVAWVTERKNVLSGFFYFAAMLTYFCGRLDEGEGARRAGGWWKGYAAVVVLFACALLSKTVTATLPAAVLVIAWWKRGRVRWADVWPMVPLVAMGAAMGAVTGYVERHYVGAHGPDFDLTPAQRVLVAGRAVWFYLFKILWPTRLAFIYEKWSVDPGVAWQWVFPIAAVAVALVLWLTRRGIGRGWAAVWLLFCGTLVPALGFVSVYPFRYSYVADHFQYLACAAVVVGVVALVARYRAAMVVGVPLAIVLAGMTWVRATVFHDARTLWAATIAANPRAWMARNNLAGILIAHGEYAAAQEQVDEVLRNWPAAPEVRVNLGLLAEARGDDGTAEAEYEKAIRLGGGETTAVYNLARLLEKHGDAARAEALYRQVLGANPRDPASRANLGKILAETGRPAEAEAMYRDEIAVNPRAVVARVNWAQLKLARRDYAGAEKLVEEALAIEPNNPAALNTLGAIRGSQGDFARAEQLFRAAIARREEFPEAHSNLAGVLAVRGDLVGARKEYGLALAIDPAFGPAVRGLRKLDAAGGAR